MLLSIALVLVCGFITGWVFEKIRLPKVIGMIFIGILLGPSVLNIISGSLINISAPLRQIALVVILTRSGLSLDLKKLKEIGLPAILMCFVPATFEIVGVAIFGPLILGISFIESLLLGAVLAAVSPAIVVPRMIKLIKEGYGKDKNIPELIMAGSSADDIYVIILFYSFLGMAAGGELSVWSLSQIPISIILGTGLGLGTALLLRLIFKRIKSNYTVKVITLLSASFLLLGIEELLKPYISVSALIAIITVGVIIFIQDKEEAKNIEKGYQKLWILFEIILFVLVGISVDLDYAFSAGFAPLLVLVIALVFRVFGVFVSLIFTNLNKKEKLFVVMSYLPKATVQASIGGIALSMSLSVGPLILTMAVLSILITAPLGAILMDNTYKKLLNIPFDEKAELLDVDL